MKNIRLLATSLLVAVCAGFSSCGDDELDIKPIENHNPSESSKIDKLFDEYVGGNHRITCRGYAEFESTILFTGLNAKHLWFALYEKTETKGIKFEWIDKEETDTIQVIHKGYGEYDTIRVNRFFPAFYKKMPSGNIVTVSLNDYYRQHIFTFGNETNRTELLKNGSVPKDWFQESIFIDNCCYSDLGSIIYEAKETPRIDSENTTLLSHVDGLIIRSYYANGGYIEKGAFCRYNFKDATTVWETPITAPFDIPSNAKRTYILTGNATNVWEYRCEVLFFDGTKRDFTFKINIDNGKIVTDEVKVTGISINEQSVSLKQGEIFQLTATVQPDNATNKKVIWSSSNEAVASVNQDGLVTANSAGEVNITVTTEDGGFSTTSIVTVTKKQDDYTSLIIGKWKMTSGDAVATHVAYKGDGTFEYTSTEDSSYKEVGRYKIDGNKLYEMYSDEDEWAISDILLLNSMTLSVQELEADGVTPSGKKFAYQRVE